MLHPTRSSGAPRLAVLLAACAAACQTVRESAPPHSDEARVVIGQPAGVWSLYSEGAEVGRLVRYDSPGTATPGGAASGRYLFAVQNAWGQDIGLVDALGRAWRYRPWSEEPEWVGTGTVIDGARRVLGLEEEPRAEPRHGSEGPPAPPTQSWAAEDEVPSIQASPDPMNSQAQPPQEVVERSPVAHEDLRDSEPHR